MPLYEYVCDDCHQRTEILQKLGDQPATVCPNCGGALRKLISAPAFQFKGSGWYLTDYANKSSGESSSAKAEDKGKSEGSAGDGASTPESKKGDAPAAAPAAPAAPQKSETSERKPAPPKGGE